MSFCRVKGRYCKCATPHGDCALDVFGIIHDDCELWQFDAVETSNDGKAHTFTYYALDKNGLHIKGAEIERSEE